MNVVGSTIGNISGKIRGNGLKAKVARGSLVLAIGTFAERGMRLVRNMILARLLAPEDFGLMAMVMVAYTAFEAFADVGIKQSIIHNKKGSHVDYLNVAWWFQAGRGIILSIVAFLLAPAICKFYNMPELLGLLQVSFLAMIFNGLRSTRIYVLEKEFQFGKSVPLVQGSRLLGTVFTIALAFYMRNVWALVIGQLSVAMITFGLSFIVCPIRPRFQFDRVCFRELLRYASGMFGLSILTMLAFQADIIVLGKVVSKEEIGMYSLALALALQPTGLLMNILSPVLLPAFAEKQDDKHSLCRALLKMCRTAVILGTPVTAFMVVCSAQILSVVYGSQYSAVAIPFGILSVSTLIRQQGAILALVYQAIGKPYLHRRYVLLRLIVIACLIYPGIALWGLSGAAATLLLASIIAVSMQVIWMRKSIGLRFSDYIVCWISGIWMTVIVLLPAILLDLLKTHSLALNISVGILSCISAYVIYYFVFWHRNQINGVKSEIRQN